MLPWDCFAVTVEITKDFSPVMRAYPVREQDGDPSKPIPNVVILDMFGFTPTAEGEIRSPMTPIMLRVHAILAQLDSALQADRARCRPAVYTKPIVSPGSNTRYTRCSARPWCACCSSWLVASYLALSLQRKGRMIESVTDTAFDPVTRGRLGHDATLATTSTPHNTNRESLRFVLEQVRSLLRSERPRPPSPRHRQSL